ncbi:putative methylesterase 14, chloroplastic, partial [Durio zibethinus]|uniref:Methylesterase 14, chloroplastic n=1 Tax=Durio zibethinus TaxID=66656 RepID=A0A6P5WZ44_DURZI
CGFLNNGYSFICRKKKDTKDNGLRSKRMGRSQRKMLAEEEFLHKLALSIALHQHRFDGSISKRIGSTSSRRHSDPLANNEKKVLESLENIKFKRIILIHGEGFGAWCWYKTIAQLEEVGLLPTALDLTGCGVDLTDTNTVTTLAEYSKPLIQYLQNLPEDEKLGSAERFMQESQFLIYGNGKDKPPTGFMFEKQLMKGLYFNQSPTKDVSLAMVSMRPTPLGPIMEKLSLSPEKYGSGRRFFIQTLDDHALSPDVQEKLVRENPTEGVFKIKGSDHCPFFSKPQSLHKILVEIVQIP